MKTCSYCGHESQDDAPKCWDCGTTEFAVPPAQIVILPDQRPTIPLPRIWIGVLLTTLWLIGSMAALVAVPRQRLTIALISLGVGLGLHGYWLFCVHRLHKVVREITSGTYRYTPNEAAFYHLIPLYGIYWVFAWTSELDKWCGQRTGKKSVPGIWGVILLISFVSYKWLDPSLGLFLMFGVVWAFKRKLRAAIQNPLNFATDTEDVAR